LLPILDLERRQQRGERRQQRGERRGRIEAARSVIEIAAERDDLGVVGCSMLGRSTERSSTAARAR
jgi:hypothetical protein